MVPDRRGRVVHARDRRARRPRCRGWRWRRGPSARRRSATGGRSGGTSARPRRRVTRCRRCTRAAPRSSWVGARVAAVAGRGVHRRSEEERAGRRRADRGRVDAGARPVPQQFAKVGTRNAMVIAVCSFALDLSDGRVGTCIGSAGRRRCGRARRRRSPRSGLSDGGRGARGSASWSRRPPLRSTTCAGRAAYRRHALSVLAKRTLTWAWRERDAADLHGQRRAARGRRRLGGRVAALRAARAVGVAGLQERVRAGRVRVVLGVPGRGAGVLLPGRRGPGGGARRGDRRGPRARTTSCTRSRRRSWRRARSSAGSARRG